MYGPHRLVLPVWVQGNREEEDLAESGHVGGWPGLGTAPRMGEKHRSRVADCGVQRLGEFGGAVALARARAMNRTG